MSTVSKPRAQRVFSTNAEKKNQKNDVVEHYPSASEPQGYVRSCVSSYLCRKARVTAQQCICPKQPWPACPRTFQQVMELTGVQAEVRAAAVRREGRWGDGTGLSHSTAGHCFPWGAIRLSRENAQLWAELSEPDRSAGPSPSRDLAGALC